MSVITEEMLRKMLLKKELLPGTSFAVSKNSLLTPAASGYLREHQIQVTVTDSSFLPARKTQQPVQSKKPNASNNHGKLRLELKKLQNLLSFYLIEETSMCAEGWLYFEYQQLWLKKFSQFDEPVSLKNVPAPSKNVCSSFPHSRTWQYSINEIHYQIEKICQMLEELAPERLSIFNLWAEKLQSII
ncbi:hypothetical protein [Enterococcus ratti]|uniref:Ethanolamine utilization cobalamin adenosyltransferase n=1 Tax=Enterococcus ratti TaxID=150033 RepID=A0A1L8WPB2_9ENTE|nr:hypothetical protein [Enterococcus ratti]OJG82857.1 hypothetical protein RV14_GL002149 [Enterococcus ratti]